MNVHANKGKVYISYADPGVFRFASQLPSYHKFTTDGGLVFAATRHSIELFRSVFPNTDIDDKDGTIEATIPISEVKINGTYQPKGIRPPANPPLGAHQERAIQTAISTPKYAFFHDMGTYKSGTITNIAAEQFLAKQIDRAIIITSKRGLPQFLEIQVPKWMPTNVSYRAAEFAKDEKSRAALTYPNGDLLIAFINPGFFQAFKPKKPSAKYRELIEWCTNHNVGLYIDESQNFKEWGGNRVDNLLRLFDYCPGIQRRYLFSGEPKPNGYIDLFSQFCILDQNIIGHATKQSFQNQYCVKGYSFNNILDYRNTTELLGRIAPYCEFLKITEVRDMPPQSWHDAIFQPTEEQRDLYQQIKNELRLEIEKALNETDIEVIRRTCANAASKFTVLAQISNGFFYKDLPLGQEEGSPREVHQITTERVDFVLEDLVAPDQKTIIFARFHQDLQMLKEGLEERKISAVEFSGRISDKQNEANKRAFSDPSPMSPRVFYATVDAGGESLDGLQVANRTVYFSNNFNWGKRNQSESRTWRGGQDQPCQYWDVFGFPIDRMIRRNHAKKEDASQQMRSAVAMAKLLEEV